MRSLADHAAAGDLGDLPDWLAAEQRWERQGLTLEDILYVGDLPPFDRHISRVGFPSVGIFRVYTHGKPDQVLEFLSGLEKKVGIPTHLRWFFVAALGDHSVQSTPVDIPPELVIRFIQEKKFRSFGLDAVQTMARWAFSDPSWLQCLDEIGKLVLGFHRTGAG